MDRHPMTREQYLEAIADCCKQISKAAELQDLAWIESQQKRRAWLRQRMRERWPLTSRETVEVTRV